jgi:hypothetical protein
MYVCMFVCVCVCECLYVSVCVCVCAHACVVWLIEWLRSEVSGLLLYRVVLFLGAPVGVKVAGTIVHGTLRRTCVFV